VKKVQLEHIKDKSHPYKVPEGYFQELEKSILELTVDAPAEETKTRSLWSGVPRWSWAVAASVILALTAVLVFKGQSLSYVDGDLLSGISDEEIMMYLANYNLNEYEIVGDLSSEQFDELFAEESILDGLPVEDGDLDDLILEYEALDETLEI